MSSAAIRKWASGLAFVFLSSLLVVTASERVYWYLGGVGFEQNLLIAAFYMIPTLAALWAIGSGASSRLHQMVLAGAIFGFVVEGVLTTVIYEDGPLPLLAALFVGWHGLLSVVCFWYLTRKLLLERRLLALGVGAAVTGLLWGIWSIVYRLPEALEGHEETHSVMEPGEFAVYALVVGVIFAVTHWLIGFVWPQQFRPEKWGRRGIAVLLLGYAALAVLPAVPWAPIKFGVLVGTMLRLLRRSRETTLAEPSAIESLQGMIRWQDAAILMVAPLLAGVSYAVVWSLDPSEDFVQGVFATFSGLQVLAGLVAFAWAARRSTRPAMEDVVVSPSR
jgi:hypothetical protein